MPAFGAGTEADADAFVLAATNRQRTRAEAMLDARPDIADDPWARLVLGRGFDGDPNAPGGPRDWPPLVYVCHSCFASATLARELLAHGADPNAFFVNEYGRMSALYGAAGVAHDPELTRVLLEAGADPDDGESLYHATEAESVDCLRLLLEHGAATRGTNALAHALDGDSLEHVRVLLEAGADPSEGALVAHAVRRGRGPEFVRLLAEHGADLDRPGGETWRGDVPLRTPYQHARLRGRDETAQVLEELGASTGLNAGDAAVEALARGERPSGPLPEQPDPDAQEVIVLAALRGHLERRRRDGRAELSRVSSAARRRARCSTTRRGSARRSWSARSSPAAPTLDAGGAETGTPLSWAAHGSQYHALEGRDYVGVAELLAEAGNTVDASLLEVADGPLYEWLEDRLAD